MTAHNILSNYRQHIQFYHNKEFAHFLPIFTSNKHKQTAKLLLLEYGKTKSHITQLHIIIIIKDIKKSLKRNKNKMATDWNYRQLAAEFVATALFVWAGCGAAVSSNRWTPTALLLDPGALVGIALAFGITISVLAYSIGHISGGHINPAVTLSFMLLRLQSITAGLLYMVAQCLGAIFGALILWGCNASLTANCDTITAAGLEAQISGVCGASELPNGEGYGPAFGLGVNTVDIRVSSGCAFLIELMGTYLLVFTVLQAAVHTKSTGGNAVPIAIGWAVLVAHLILIPYTGCGINPARSLGPMVVDSMGGLNYWQRGWWVFYTAPFVGSILATATYKFIFAEEEDDAGKAKKDDDVAGGDDDKDVEGQVPRIYDEDAKNTGEEAVTDDAVPHAYE